jgi:hypothetical protein
MYEDMACTGIPALAWPRDDDTIRVTWRSEGAEDEEFCRVIGLDSYGADHLKHMMQVYTALSAARDVCEWIALFFTFPAIFRVVSLYMSVCFRGSPPGRSRNF